MGLGMLGLSYRDLYELTPRSFNNKLKGFHDIREQINQNEWEQTRLIIHACLSPHSKKKLKPTEILPLPWDKKNKPKPKLASKEHIEGVIKKYNKIKAEKLN